jgi:hypothetical protein
MNGAPFLLVLAVQEGSSNPLNWAHPWSYARVGATLLLVGLSFLIAFGLYFRLRLNPERDIKTAPWPLTVFGEAVVLAVILSTLSFLLFFAWLEDDLRRLPFHSPVRNAWLSTHGWELVVALVALAVCGLCRYVLRHRQTAPVSPKR